MDAVELARQNASALHANQVTAGADPWKPLELVLRAVAHLGLSTEACAKNAAVLNGGRATFIPEEDLILYEHTDDPFERAFLIAHEIGHSQLGDDVPATTETAPVHIDPARSAEPARNGADRVVDYGRRQRREVQMDLFARELLLPRVWLKHLHIVEHQNAAAIAQRIGAPYGVVAQQLLDALLLPEQSQSEQSKKPEATSNDKQTDAIRHRGAPFLLEAGPGTGKTATLIGRIVDLLRDDVDPRRILVLTFSNKAAGEVMDRVAAVDKAAAAAMWIGTFHAFGLDLARRFASAFGLPDDPRILDRVDAVALLEDEYPRLNLKHYRDIYDPTTKIVDFLSAISRAKDEVVDAERYTALAQAMLDRAADDNARLAAGKALEVAQVYRAYERLKAARGVVDFGDLVMRPVQVLETNDSVRASLREAYDHVLVDEYQDVNRSSVRLLKALTGDGANLWVVGDARQSIYRFRGASAQNMAHFDVDFPSAVTDSLELNYRSLQEVLDAARAFAADMAVGGIPTDLRAKRGNSTVRPSLRTVRLGEEQAVAIADAVLALKAQGYAFRDQALLCTGNDKLAEFARDLERLGLPVLYLGNLFDRPEVKELLALASLLIDRRATGLLRTACMPDFAMSLDDVVTVMTHLRRGDVDAGAWRATDQSIEGLSAQGVSALKRLALCLESFDHTSSVWNVLAGVLLDRTRIAASIASSASITDGSRGIALWQLMNFLRGGTLGGGVAVQRTLDRIRRVLRLGDDRELRQPPNAAQSLDAMKLMTVHGSKGLEFPVVHFPGMNTESLNRMNPPPSCLPPHGMIEGVDVDAVTANQDEQKAERECLFYVGITRARDRLQLYAATEKSNGAARSLSPYIARLGNTIETAPARLSRPLPPDPADASVAIAIDGPMRLDSSILGLMGSCPRRALYTHLLHIGGKRTPTAYLDMHGVVRDVVKEIVRRDIRDEAKQLGLIEAGLRTAKLDVHGYAADYAELAQSLVRTLHTLRADTKTERPVPLVTSFGKDEVRAVPDDIAVDANGRRTLRHISTGHKRSIEKELSARVFSVIAGAHDASAKVEFVSLADAETTPSPFSARQLQNARTKIDESLKQVRAGDFPAEPSSFVCPNCPALFICGALPKGTLKKSFEEFPI